MLKVVSHPPLHALGSERRKLKTENRRVKKNSTVGSYSLALVDEGTADVSVGSRVLAQKPDSDGKLYYRAFVKAASTSTESATCQITFADEEKPNTQWASTTQRT